MNIWDPIWKQDTEDGSTSQPIYKMKPVYIEFKDIIFNSSSIYSDNILMTQQVVIDIEFSEKYINTLDVDKRKIWVLDDGGCVVNCKTQYTGLPTKNEIAVNESMAGDSQEKWEVKKITNGLRLTVDLRKRWISPIVSGNPARFFFKWNFGSVKLLVPEPFRFDPSTVTINVGFLYSRIGTNKFAASTGVPVLRSSVHGYSHSTELTQDSYKVLNQLQIEKESLVALHKFTIESANNLISEIKDIVSVPTPTRNYVMDNHPEYPIAYARSNNNHSIGSSIRPRKECHKRISPTTKIDQTQSLGRSSKLLRIVKQILSIIKRRKREIK